MAKDSDHLPFKVGQEAESKCFTVGFRSAWFRCKIKKIGIQKGQIGYFLEFFDFPDEKISWTKLYQKPPRHTISHGESKPELMVRPSFPPFFRESVSPDSYPASDVVAVVEDDWEVGDLVDWFSDGCFWSARVTQILGKDKVQIELPEPPIGEGQSYEAHSKDLRPSLSWSPEKGWTVPMSREYGFSKYTARLVQPFKQDEKRDEDTVMENSTERNDTPAQLKLDGTGKEKHSRETSSSHGERRDLSIRKVPSKVVPYGPLNFQELPSRESNINSLRQFDTVESAIMELEELANKIRWLKGLLQFGFRWSNAMKPSWKILENCG